MRKRNYPFKTYRSMASLLRIMEVEEIKSVPFSPTPHPFVERLILSARNELLDHTLFWSSSDLQNKLNNFQDYFNNKRGHCGISGSTPAAIYDDQPSNVVSLDNYRWKKHCRGLFQLPMAA